MAQPLFPAVEKQWQGDLWVQSQPGLHCEFQARQGYTVILCLRKVEKPSLLEWGTRGKMVYIFNGQVLGICPQRHCFITDLLGNSRVCCSFSFFLYPPPPNSASARCKKNKKEATGAHLIPGLMKEGHQEPHRISCTRQCHGPCPPPTAGGRGR